MAKEKYNTINEYHLNRHEPDKMQFAIHDLKTYGCKHQEDITKPHIHSYYQVIWFKKGKGKHFVDFKAYDIADNTVFFIAKNQIHYFDENTRNEGILIHFNETFLLQKDQETDFCLKCNLFSNPYEQPSCRVGKNTVSVLDEYVSQIKRELENSDDFGKEELLRVYLKSFLIQIQREKNAFEKTHDVPFVLDEKRIQLIKFINLVDTHYKKGFTVAEYARLLHISSRSLSDLTQQQLNKTPSQMVQERIILEAQRMLLYSNLNISQVGYRLGFDDASYFMKYFKKYTGVSPSEFRKSVS